MGEMSGGSTPGSDAGDAIRFVQDGQVATDVEGVMAAGTKDSLHVFDVDRNDFYNNMSADRKRTRFKADTAASQYLRGTKYKNPFYVRYTDETDGKAYIRKVK